MEDKKEITATPASYYTSSLTPIILEEGKHVQVSFEGMQVDNRGNLNKNIRGKLVIKKKNKSIPSFANTEKFSRKDISSNEKIEKHAAWAAEFLPKYDSVTKENIHEILQKEIGMVFIHVLEDAGVYKCTPEGRDAFMRFVKAL